MIVYFSPRINSIKRIINDSIIFLKDSLKDSFRFEFFGGCPSKRKSKGMGGGGSFEGVFFRGYSEGGETLVRTYM